MATALHEIAGGAIWPREAIAARQTSIRQAGLECSVVESIPVYEDIMRGDKNRDRWIEAYCTSLNHLADAGIRVDTNKFTLLLDWRRTDLVWELPDGARALRFDPVAVAAYDVHILRRQKAARDYDHNLPEAANAHYATLSAEARGRLERTIIAGPPGSEESFTSALFLTQIESYSGIDADRLRANHVAFIDAVCPTGERLSLRLVVHHDERISLHE